MNTKKTAYERAENGTIFIRIQNPTTYFIFLYSKIAIAIEDINTFISLNYKYIFKTIKFFLLVLSEDYLRKKKKEK